MKSRYVRSPRFVPFSIEPFLNLLPSFQTFSGFVSHPNRSPHDIRVGEQHGRVHVGPVVELNVAEAPELSSLPVLGETDALDVATLAERLPDRVLFKTTTEKLDKNEGRVRLSCNFFICVLPDITHELNRDMDGHRKKGFMRERFYCEGGSWNR